MRDSGPSPRTIEGGKKRVYGVGFTVDGINGAPNIFYAHLENVQVSKGDTIRCGQLLGFIADSGYIKYDHVHIGVDGKINIRNLIDSSGGIKCASGKKLTSKEVTSPEETSSSKEQKSGKSSSSSSVSSVASKLTGGRGGIRYSDSDTLLANLAGNYLNMNKGLNIKESREYGNFGKNASVGENKIVLPSADNTTIDAPIAGKIVKTNQLGCRNELSILHEVNGEEYYLTYCDITNPSVSIGDKVRRGTRLGSITNDISIYVFNLLGQKLDFLSVGREEKKNKGNKEDKEDKEDKGGKGTSYSFYSSMGKKRYSDPDNFAGDALKLPFKVLSSLTKGGLNSVTSKKVDDEETSKPFELPGGLKSVTSKKVNEEIERIKRLLK
jgi:biotin carboxyl carrier protein